MFPRREYCSSFKMHKADIAHIFHIYGQSLLKLVHDIGGASNLLFLINKKGLMKITGNKSGSLLSACN